MDNDIVLGKVTDAGGLVEHNNLRIMLMEDIVCAYMLIEIKHRDKDNNTLSLLENAANNIDVMLGIVEGFNHEETSDIMDILNITIDLIKLNDVLTSDMDVYDLAWASLSRCSVH